MLFIAGMAMMQIRDQTKIAILVGGDAAVCCVECV